jgi:diguanylate cyclase (GGDEF)-like protein/PAS domain S-box-containing protein
MASGRTPNLGKGGIGSVARLVGRSPLRSLREVETLAQFVRNLREGVYITTVDGRILDANPAFLDMLSVSSLKKLRHFTAQDLLVDPARREEELAILARDGAVREFEIEIRRPDGSIRTVLDTAYQVNDPVSGETLYHGILIDISDRKALERQLQEMAIRDPLTGAYNRHHLAHLEEELAQSSEPCGAIVTDIDHFKTYNDRFGHATGDRLLVQLSRFLACEVRSDDALIRLGGDEFLLLLRGSSAERAEEIAERLRTRGASSAPVSFSLGWAIRREGEPLQETIRRADQRLIRVRIEERSYEKKRRD